MDSRSSDQDREEPAKGPERETTLKNEIIDWVKALAIAAVFVIVIRMFLFTTYMVDGPSMEPNFYTGERIIVNKVLYDMRAPKRGEVIVFHAPDGTDYIKRVVGLPGDRIRVQNDSVFVNGAVIDEPYIREPVDEKHKQGKSYNYHNTPGEAELTVPANHMFVMGDNRNISKDSRDIGFIGFDKVVGRADLRIWPLTSFRIIKH